MKVSHVQLTRYKRFSSKSLSFKDDMGRIQNLVVLIGNNGTGKSSVLQAIAATLGTATHVRNMKNPGELEWPGFVFDSLSAGYRGYSTVELTIEFKDDELDATQEYFHDSDFATQETAVSPDDKHSVTLTMTNNPEAHTSLVQAPSAGQFFQFRGRYYAYNLLNNRRGQPNMFKRVGAVFWYHEHRTSNSLSYWSGNAHNENRDELEFVRDRLRDWFSGAPDNVNRFNDLYKKLFPDRRLERVELSYTDRPSDILFSESGREYELAELSGGERAVLPLLVDFVQWDIHHSVILIDEIELHLHPPLQQALIALLPKLGNDNQFIITTHSDAVYDVVLSSNIKRLDEIRGQPVNEY